MTEAGADGVRCEFDGAVLHLILDRPEMGNALRGQDCVDAVAILDAVDRKGDARAVLIRGEGKHFCTGADLVSANDPDGKPRVGHLARSLAAGPHRLISALWNCPVPTISMVHGRAMGLGMHLAVACDFTVAAESAQFTAPFRSRGFSVDSGGSFLLQRLVGLRRARQLLLRGITIDGSTAADWGLVDTAVPAQSLLAEANSLAAELAAGPTFSLGHTKRLLNRFGSGGIDDALTAEAASVEVTVRSGDFKEGLRAFAERREPRFDGN
ncbi:MAG: enoyl-CoA hydratase/isomerase family protein [Mycobacterium sp.]